jgi:HAD superfamily phosphoserine phosphatase-like hydrolase
MLELLFYAYRTSKNKTKKILFILKAFRYMPIYILFKLHLISNKKAKLLLYYNFFKYIKKNEFNKICFNFSKTLDNILNKNIYNKFIEHKNKNHRVIVISASINNYLKHWCKKENVELLCTKLKFNKKNKLLNKKKYKKKYPNCYGKEKLKRITKYINSKELQKYKNIYSYGDSSSDKYILSIANYKIKI